MKTSFTFGLDGYRCDGWKSNRTSHEWGWDGERRAGLRKDKRAHICKDLQETRSNDVVNAKYTIFFLDSWKLWSPVKWKIWRHYFDWRVRWYWSQTKNWCQTVRWFGDDMVIGFIVLFFCRCEAPSTLYTLWTRVQCCSRTQRAKSLSRPRVWLATALLLDSGDLNILWSQLGERTGGSNTLQN